VQRLIPSATRANSINWNPRRFLKPKQQTARASAEPGNNGLEPWRTKAVVVEVVTVRVVEAAAPECEGVTVPGEKLHDAPAGSPEQLNVTGEENEFSGVTMTVVVLLCPATTSSSPGDTATEKFGSGRFRT
jgi:hypothetical protein